MQPTAPAPRTRPSDTPHSARAERVTPAIAYQLADAMLDTCVHALDEDCYRDDLLRRGFSPEVIDRHREDALSIAGRRCTLFEASAPIPVIAA